MSRAENPKKDRIQHRPRGRQARAFTIVELLVVIMIIGLLAALLLPALREAVEKSRRAVCVNNQRQIYVASLAYANDFNGFLPPGPDDQFGAGITAIATQNRGMGRIYFLKNYLGASLNVYPGSAGDTNINLAAPCRVLLCPSGNRLKDAGLPWPSSMDFSLLTSVGRNNGGWETWPVNLSVARARKGQPVVFSMDLSAADDGGLATRGPYQWPVTPHRNRTGYGIQGMNVVTLDGAGRWVLGSQCWTFNAFNGWHRVFPLGYDAPAGVVGSATSPTADSIGYADIIQVWSGNSIGWAFPATFGY